MRYRKCCASRAERTDVEGRAEADAHAAACSDAESGGADSESDRRAALAGPRGAGVAHALPNARKRAAHGASGVR